MRKLTPTPLQLVSAKFERKEISARASTRAIKSVKREVKGFDARNISQMQEDAQTQGTHSMDSDARIAQGEDILEDDEKIVEWVMMWFKRPDMLSGGYVKIVSPEMPNEFVRSLTVIN